MPSVEFSISDVLGRAWELTKKHGLVIALFSFVISMVGSGFSQIFGFSFGTPSWLVDPSIQPTPGELKSWLGCYILVLPMLLLIQLVLQAGLQNMFLLALRDKSPDLSAFKLPLYKYGYFILVSVVMGLIVYVGILCCIVPGIWLAVRLAYAPLLVLDRPDCKLEEALKGSWRMTEGYFGKLFGLFLVAYLITCAGLLACCIGVCFTGVVAGFALVISYDILKPVNGDGNTKINFRQFSSEAVPPTEDRDREKEQPKASEKECNGTVESFEQESAPAEKAECSDEKTVSQMPEEGKNFSHEEPVASMGPEGLFDVVLLNAGDDREAVTRIVMNSVYGKGADEVRAMLDAVPSVLMEKVPYVQAERLKKILEEAGARVLIR